MAILSVNVGTAPKIREIKKKKLETELMNLDSSVGTGKSSTHISDTETEQET